MASARIRAKTLSPADRSKLLEILANHDVYATNIIEEKDGYVITLSKQGNLDKIFETTCQEQLLHLEFAAIIPPDLKVR